jgi:hypothetical protein
MAKLRFRISISLDGYTAGPNQSVKNPLGLGGMQLHEWAFPLKAWREPQGLKAGTVPERRIAGRMVLHLVPTLLGGGERLFDGITDTKGLKPVQTMAAPDVTHLKFALR